MSVYEFNIVAEAKVRTLVLLTRKYYPDYTIDQIEDHLKRLIGYAVEKELKEKQE